ncbi:MAG: histone deacetylase [Thermoplasmata archaeon]|nr:MAG: histone deacetylase [Thermoplasmata archaeon]
MLSVVYHPEYEEHVIWDGHPERPERLAAIREWLISVLGHEPSYVEPEIAKKDDLLSVHAEEYVSFVESFDGLMDPDTYVHGDKTYRIALRAVGGALKAAEMALSSTPTFALVRPPGHHATSLHGGGFCYFNNIAVAANRLMERYKVAIVDIDAHHGNGTAEIFGDTDKVLYISTHEWGIYPGTGRAEDVGNADGEGFTVNIPMPHGSGDSSYSEALNRVILPIINEYKPHILLVSLGADAHYMDPLTSLTLSTAGYRSLALSLLSYANKSCKGRIAYMLEGGYHLDALAEVVGGIIIGDERAPMTYTEVYDGECRARDAIEKVLSVHSQYWSSLC